MDGVQPQPAFPQGFNVWGIQGAARLQTRLLAAAVTPAGVSTSIQPTDNRPRFYFSAPKGEHRLGSPKFAQSPNSSRPAESRAKLSPALTSGPLRPQVFFWATDTGPRLPPCARGRGDKRKPPSW